MNLVKRTAPQDVNAFIWAMYLLWASRPSKPEPELDGSYFIGDAGETPQKNWERPTPYSLAKPQ